MDVGEWLRGLGLRRYETVFREHAIDMDVLADLTDGELTQIGVPLGDRKRLLKAIASLSKIEPSSSANEDAPPAEANMPATPVPIAAGRDAERRPVAVMFCDLVGSTSCADAGSGRQEARASSRSWSASPVLASRASSRSFA